MIKLFFWGIKSISGRKNDDAGGYRNENDGRNKRGPGIARVVYITPIKARSETQSPPSDLYLAPHLKYPRDV